MHLFRDFVSLLHFQPTHQEGMNRESLLAFVCHKKVRKIIPGPSKDF